MLRKMKSIAIQTLFYAVWDGLVIYALTKI